MSKSGIERVRLWTRIKGKLGISLGRFHLYDPQPLSLLPSVPLPPNRTARLTFSIVTPSYNQGRYIGETVRSVLSQNYPLLEYIIQDSLSIDETHQVVTSFDDPRLEVHIEKDRGQADAINRGFLRSSGDIMAYLNSDDLLLPNALVSVAAFFDDHPEVDAVYANRLIINEESGIIGHWVLPAHSPWVTRLVDYVPQETLFWRRRIWERVGGELDASLQFAMDWDLILKFQAHGARIQHIPLLLGAFRVHASQKTQAEITTGREEMMRVRRRYTGRLVRYLLFPLHIIYLAKHMLLHSRSPEYR